MLIVAVGCALDNVGVDQLVEDDAVGDELTALSVTFPVLDAIRVAVMFTTTSVGLANVHPSTNLLTMGPPSASDVHVALGRLFVIPDCA